MSTPPIPDSAAFATAANALEAKLRSLRDILIANYNSKQTGASPILAPVLVDVLINGIVEYMRSFAALPVLFQSLSALYAGDPALTLDQLVNEFGVAVEDLFPADSQTSSSPSSPPVPPPTKPVLPMT